MGKLFTITTDIKSVVADALDDLITEMGNDCKLVYPPKWNKCTNCVYDPVGNISANVWKSGGPMAFDAGTTCPLCGGKGKKATEVSEVFHWGVAWDPQRFYMPSPFVNNIDIKVPHAYVQTKGYQKDLPKVLKADHMILNLPFEPYIRLMYRRAGEPGDPSNIVQGRYFVATWERKL